GATGPQGVTGPTGPTGATGVTGPTGTLGVAQQLMSNGEAGSDVVTVLGGDSVEFSDVSLADPNNGTDITRVPNSNPFTSISLAPNKRYLVDVNMSGVVPNNEIMQFNALVNGVEYPVGNIRSYVTGNGSQSTGYGSGSASYIIETSGANPTTIQYVSNMSGNITRWNGDIRVVEIN
ncbi:MAG: hypothetical protein ACRC3Y_05575, partial [Romboutsia sp.]